MAEVVNSLGGLVDLWVVMVKEFKINKYLRVTWTTKHERSMDQNALWHKMYQRIAETLSDGSAIEANYFRSECKVLIGAAIMYRDCEEFRIGWDDFFATKTYEQQLYFMGPNKFFGRHGFPVTSLMDTKQGAEYTESIVRMYGDQGVYFNDLLDKDK